VVVNDYIFVIGGDDVHGNSNDVYYSKIGSTGELSNWTNGGNEMKLPKGTCCGAAVVAGEYIYLIGGYAGGYTAEVYSMKIPDFAQSSSPIVFLPGMMASWNKSLLHWGENAPNEEWSIAPYVNNYDNFFGSLDTAGLERDKDYFVYAYDWRKSIASNASDLADYIDTKINTKVNLVGHSMGGLIARTYAYNNKEKINKLVTVGSPHRGAVKAYYPWEGADLKGLSNTEKIALRLYLRAVSDVFTNDVEAIRREVPSLKEILPVDDFLTKRDGSLIPIAEMKQQNSFLAGLNSLDANLLPPTYTVFGSGMNTWRYLSVVNRSNWDKVWDKWEDGKPVNEQYESGDETVLAESAVLPEPAGQIDVDEIIHGDLLSEVKGQKAVFDALTLEGLVFKIKDSFKYNQAIVAAMGSAATFEIYDPAETKYVPTDNVLVIDDAQPGIYRLNIILQDKGGYNLYLGRLLGNDEAWEEFSTESGEINFLVNWDNPNLGTDPVARALSKIDRLKLLVSDSSLSTGNKGSFLTQLELIEKQINDLQDTDENRQAWIISFSDNLIKRIQNDWREADESLKKEVIGVLRKMKLDVAEAVGNLI
jgi:pimeloyl-ACP methyl ester carboxylesterase